VPVVVDDGVSTTNFTQLHATWSSSDPGSGLAAYEYRIGTTPTGSEVAPATGIGLATEVTKTSLTLIQGQRYYIAARAKNHAGLWSNWGVSDGIDANASAPVINAFTPAGGKFPAGAAVTLSASATDADGDALEFQFKVHGVVVQPWSASNTYAWTPTTSDLGLRTLGAEVRDGHGAAGIDRPAVARHELLEAREVVLRDRFVDRLFVGHDRLLDGRLVRRRPGAGRPQPHHAGQGHPEQAAHGFVHRLHSAFPVLCFRTARLRLLPRRGTQDCPAPEVEGNHYTEAPPEVSSVHFRSPNSRCAPGRLCPIARCGPRPSSWP